MKCQGKFKFRGLTQKDGGTFTTNGRVVNYNASYQLKLDETTDKGVYERNIKIPLDSPLVAELAQKKLYEEIIMEFEIVFFGSNVRVIPAALIR